MFKRKRVDAGNFKCVESGDFSNLRSFNGSKRAEDSFNSVDEINDSSDIVTMTLEVLVSKATNLINLEKIGKSDPLVILLFQGVKKKTNYISSNLNPEWNEKFVWEIGKQPPSPNDSLSIRVMDHEHVGRNRLMGETTLLLRNALESKEPIEYELTLFDHNQRPTAGTLFLTVGYSKPEKTPEPTGLESQTQQVGVGAVGGEKHFDQKMGQPNVDLLRNDAMGMVLSKNKTKFQIRVYVLEARNLIGSNLNPLCQVVLSHLAKQTQVVKASSNPYWNEIFFFTLQCSAMDLFNENLEFKVQNSRALRSNMLIGNFKIDLGQVYSQPKHAYLNKWLLLKNDDEESVSDVMGYLKASMAVIGPGDDIPDFGTSDSEKDDVEGNMLLPTGAQLKPASFVFDLYQAADLPRMDTGVLEGVKRIFNIDDKRELIDPYMEISFAGNMVTSKIIYGDDHPCWNEKLYIGFQFPSVCENIQLTLKDWDRVSEDDTIAVSHIRLPYISAPGNNGFLPYFGPTWINFYGAPREFSLLDSSKSNLNNGQEEGCSFRGRVLVALKTDLGTYPNVKSSHLSSDDTLRVQFFCRRRRFRLHATFLDATMVNVIDAPVEFEVSIGNFGNKFEDRFVPSPSATQPTNAVFDGCQYYYLPWKNNKPSVIVVSQWEDMTFRLETLNLLSRIVKDMETEIKKVTKNSSSSQQIDAQNVIRMLVDKFLKLTDVELPEAIPGQQRENELDRLLRKRRKDEIQNLRDQAKIMLESELDLHEGLQDLRDIVQELKNLVYEPQNSIPDIIIWMLCGTKRIAYKRIPAHEILFSPDEKMRGKNCNKTLTLLLQRPRCKTTDSHKLPALLRLKLWFGLEIHEKYWQEVQAQTDAKLTVYAETYENQVNIFGNWTSKGPTMSRPSWSDSSGTVKLKPDMFIPPTGWRFEGDWFVNPEPSLRYDDDAGRHAFLDDVFENQNRLPAGSWTSATSTWTDIRGDPSTPRDDIEAPPGWEWEDIWQVDVHRAVDEEGWEYTVEATLGGFQPVEKTYHLCRRRRWVRLRKWTDLTSVSEPDEDAGAGEENEGWEYSTLFNLRFHAKKRRMDLVRRRRWHRKLIAENPFAPLVFKMETDAKKADTEDAKISSLSCPRLCLDYTENHAMQLRVYLYQARDLIAGDKSGFSDPYATVCFMSQSQKTEVVFHTLNPTWDQTLIFDSVTIFGNAAEIKEQPPQVVIEVYDRDAHGDDDFLGRVLLTPVVQSNASFSSPSLTWHTVRMGDNFAGEVLASCEMFFVENYCPLEPPKRGSLFIVPSRIRPVLQRSAIEVRNITMGVFIVARDKRHILCWGMRNMKTFELCPISSPSVEFECGGSVVQSKPIKDIKKSPNFGNPVLYFEMLLPQEANFMPPMNIKVRDHRPFGRKPVIGTHAITNLHSYMCRPLTLDLPNGGQQIQNATDMPDTVIDIVNEVGSDVKMDSEVDWWAKYYASTGEISKAGRYLQLGYDTLQVYPSELEKVEPFNGFSDFLNTFRLKRGISKDIEESNTVGEFKGTFRIYPLPSDPNEPRPQRLLKALPIATKEEVIVRVYIVKASELAPKDPNGKADPYVHIRLGKKEVTNRKNYKPNTLNPIFGEVFEVSGVLPSEKDLTIAVWDYDLMSSDDLIGQTVIDLENRYLTKYRATCGLPQSYQLSGINKWRDCKKPTEILEDICVLHNLPVPVYLTPTVAKIGSRAYTLEEFERESKPISSASSMQRLALHILKSMNLVPEHVETRALFNPASPDLQQGKLTMWVDIFPKSLGTPGPVVDISPRIPLKYELRVIIWNTYEVPLDERSVVAGESMSDIYVKCSLAEGKLQKTDVHYRSMDGEGNFNWRMIFPFEYLPAENKVVITKKEHLWSLDQTEKFVPPKFLLQVWDNDLFSPDDFLGSFEFSLMSLPQPAKTIGKCGLHQLGIEVGDTEDRLKYNPLQPYEKQTNLFEKKHVKGFWPCYTYKADQGYALAGKVEMELELLPLDEAAAKPAGLGRDEPNVYPTLDPPNRPATSFLWLTSPWKSFKFVLWNNYKWHCITLFVIVLAILLILLFIYSFPEAIAYRLVS